MSVLNDIEIEAGRASGRYGSFVSSHEGYGVLCEEVSELLDAIRSNVVADVRAEAIQVASVAFRIAMACDDSDLFRHRSGMEPTR